MLSYHRGPSRLVISIDIGATSSAVAWQYLQTDTAVPEPTNVAQWPDAPSVHDVKIPTCILYRGTEAIAFGCEAERQEDDAPGARMIRNPKLQLHPKWIQDMASMMVPSRRPGQPHVNTFDKPILPPYLSIDIIYRDFLIYLLKQTRESFLQSHQRGSELWELLIQDAQFIIGAPNGWGPQEKEVLIKAMCATGYCRKKGLVMVVAEGEASLLYLLHHVPSAVPLRDGALFTVCDAGGSTIDITLVSEGIDAQTLLACNLRKSTLLNAFKKVHCTSPRPYQAVHAKIALADFDNGLKKRWDGSSVDPGRLRFSYLATDTCPENPETISRGKVYVKADVLNRAFGTCVQHILTAIAARLQDENGNKSEVLAVVGGFGDSPYLQAAIRNRLGTDIEVLCPQRNAPGVKAVSAGGPWLASYGAAVESRAALFTFGVNDRPKYNPDNPEHAHRDLDPCLNGFRYVWSGFSPLITRGEVSSSDDFRSGKIYRIEAKELEDRRKPSVTLFAYLGEDLPNFLKRNKQEGSGEIPNFNRLGALLFDTIELPVTSCTTAGGTQYFQSEFRIGVSFGGLDIKVRIESADGSVQGQHKTFHAISSATPITANTRGRSRKLPGVQVFPTSEE